MTAFWSAVAVVFAAELGDKTQLVALGFGARYRLRWVLPAMALAYLFANLVSVVIGAVLGAALPGDVVRLCGGVLFVVFAVLTVTGGGENEAQHDAVGAGSGDTGTPAVRVIGSVAVAMFMAELGDKTMLATATLASTRNPLLVWAGASVGIFLAGAVGAIAGRAIGDRVPEGWVRFGAAILFAVFGVALIASAIG